MSLSPSLGSYETTLPVRATPCKSEAEADPPLRSFALPATLPLPLPRRTTLPLSPVAPAPVSPLPPFPTRSRSDRPGEMGALAPVS